MFNSPDVDSLDSYLLAAAKSVLHPPKGLLRHPYIVPGGTYSDQLWDWDSFWVVHALLNAPVFSASPERALYLEHARGSLLNFLDNQNPETGAIPILVLPKEGDVFGCGRGNTMAALLCNQAKPVLAQMALAICRASGDAEWLRPHYPKLIRFLDRWWNGYKAASCDLLVWGSDVAIGVDSDPTTYGRPEFSSANLLLNCLYYQDLSAAFALSGLLNDSDSAPAVASVSHRARKVADSIRAECWDPVDQFFYTVDVHCEDARDRYIPRNIPRGMGLSWRTFPMKVKLFTGFLPLWCGIASDEQAALLVEKHLKNAREFATPFGVPSLARNERMYAPHINSANPSNWHGPIWIVANYLVYSGLARYGYRCDAIELGTRTRELLECDLRRTGTLHECYHPDTGAPNFNEGFISWNLLASLMGEAEVRPPSQS